MWRLLWVQKKLLVVCYFLLFHEIEGKKSWKSLVWKWEGGLSKWNLSHRTHLVHRVTMTLMKTVTKFYNLYFAVGVVNIKYHKMTGYCLCRASQVELKWSVARGVKLNISAVCRVPSTPSQEKLEQHRSWFREMSWRSAGAADGTSTLALRTGRRLRVLSACSQPQTQKQNTQPK